MDIDHDQRLTPGDRVEDAHAANTFLSVVIAVHTQVDAPVAGSVKNASASTVSPTSITSSPPPVSAAHTRIVLSSDPVATRSAPVAGSTPVTRAVTSSECPWGSASIAATGSRLGRHTTRSRAAPRPSSGP